MGYRSKKNSRMIVTRNSSLLGKITVLFVICCCSLSAQAKYGGGMGEPNDPYLIYTAEQMNEIGLTVNSGDWDKCFKLMADIDLSGYTGPGPPPQPPPPILKASNPNPADGAFGISAVADLSWTAGFGATSHDVYFGTSSTPPFAGNETFTTFDPGIMANSTTYYWRIDEVNDSVTTTGDIWSFTTMMSPPPPPPLTADIDLSAYTGTSFNIIGIDYYNPFTGVFDGNGHTISNFTYHSTDRNYIGLFGYVGDWFGNAEIKNLYLVNPDINAGNGNIIGGVVGCLENAIISNCSVNGGRICGEDSVGGVVGIGYGNDGLSIIHQCHSNTTVSGRDFVGGLVGKCSVRRGIVFIENSSAIGEVSGDEYVGGLAGMARSSFYIENCYSSGKVRGLYCVGGLLGESGMLTISCYSSCLVEGEQATGGLVAMSDYGVSYNCYWDIDVSGQATSALGVGKTTLEMMQADTFVRWGACENDGIWTLDEGNDYPRLARENRPGDPISTYLSDYLTGAGTEEEPYKIYTADELNRIGLFPCDWDKHFKLMADIDLSGFTGTAFNIIGYWVRLSSYYYKDYYKAFTGVFDGNGHTISNFTYTSTRQDNLGLFGYVDGDNAEIRNLVLIDPNVDTGTRSSTGSLVGANSGTITNCYIEGGNASAHGNVGGLVGSNHGTINNCYSTGNISGIRNAGSLVGYNGGRIYRCYADGYVTGMEHHVGGLAGTNSGLILESGAAAAISSSTVWAVGGLVGRNYHGTISNCYAASSIQGGNIVGGMVGDNYFGKIYNSYSAGNVSAHGSVGGLVGNNWLGTVKNCYSSASVLGAFDVGGLVGLNSWCGGGGCQYGEIWDSFWDVKTSGQVTSDGGIGLSTVQMFDINSYLGQGWDFVGEFENGPSDMWAQNPVGGYPILWWQLDPLPSLPTFSGGTGTTDNPYRIANPADLSGIGYNPRLMDKHFSLTKDINMINVTFFPIGNLIYPFTGKFNGNGYTIYHLVIDYPEEEYIGFFRYVEGPDAEISGLNLRKVDVTGKTQTGALAGIVNGNVRDCSVQDCNVYGKRETGGLIGILYGRMENCIARGSISSEVGEWDSVGGLVGELRGEISYCSSYVNVSGGVYVGGLVGYNAVGTINDSSSISNLNGISYVGGLVGRNLGGGISRCYSDGNVYGDKFVGGLVGLSFSDSMILQCYSNANVEGKEFGGGLVGANAESIYNCYSTGAVGGGRDVGGLVGYNYNHGKITNCYSTGTVSGTTEFGGLVGKNDREITDSFWDIDTSELSISDGGTGLVTNEMQMAGTFTDAGWDFNTPLWIIDDGVDYPRLRWEKPVLHAEPEVTLGIGNTISWEPMVGAQNEYYAECSEDENFTSIIFNSGWITETSCEFTNLQLGKHYWYSVKARNAAGIETNFSNVESSLQSNLFDAVETLLSPESLKNKNMKNSLMNKIDDALEMIDKGLYKVALNKLENDILQKTNGCGRTGQPDKNDWIITCEQQSQVYPLIIETIEHVKGLME
jgi:hypothetical protein